MKQVQPILLPATISLDEYLCSLVTVHRLARYNAWLRECDRARVAPHRLKLEQWKRRLASPASAGWRLGGGISTGWLVRSASERVTGEGRRVLVLATAGGAVWVKFGHLELEAVLPPLVSWVIAPLFERGAPGRF